MVQSANWHSYTMIISDLLIHAPLKTFDSCPCVKRFLIFLTVSATMYRRWRRIVRIIVTSLCGVYVLTFMSLGARQQLDETPLQTPLRSDIGYPIKTTMVMRDIQTNGTNGPLKKQHANNRKLFLAEPSPTEIFPTLGELDAWSKSPRLSWPHACEINEDIPEGPYLVILVHSHVLNAARRDAIRETWGRITRDYDTPHHVNIFFLLGLPEDNQDIALIDKEARLYRDILQWHFIDNYKNLSVKSLLGLRWVTEYCRSAKFVMKADDDVYLNVTHILKFIVEQSMRTDFNSSDYLTGHINKKSPVLRIGQWGISASTYPLKTYPPYCSGAAYVLALPTGSRLWKECVSRPKLTVLPVEDVFITGIMSALAGFQCQHDNHFPGWMTLVSIDGVQDLLQGALFGLHGVSDHKIRLLNKISQKCYGCLKDQSLIEAFLGEDTEYEIYFDNMDEGFTDLWSPNTLVCI